MLTGRSRKEANASSSDIKSTTSVRRRSRSRSKSIKKNKMRHLYTLDNKTIPRIALTKISWLEAMVKEKSIYYQIKLIVFILIFIDYCFSEEKID